MRSSQQLKLHYRVLDVLDSGYVRVEFVAPIPRPAPDRLELIDVFVSDIPIALVPLHLRMPNTDLEITVEGRENVVQVQAFKPGHPHSEESV